VIKADQLSSRSKSTRRQILDAAAATLKEEGFAAASTRAIARRGGFNQALVFYHFGTLNDLLLAVLDDLGALRMEQFRADLESVKTWPDLVAMARRIYTDDLLSGHMAVVSQLVAGSVAHPELGPQVVARMEPWIAFGEEAVARVVGGTPLEAVLRPRELAYTAVTLYLGINLLTQLDADRSRTEALFAAAERASAFLDA
jgi:AcrR family transcriptional regulator